MPDSKVAVIRVADSFTKPLIFAIDRHASKAFVIMEVRVFKSAGADQPRTMQESKPLKVFTFTTVDEHESSSPEPLALDSGEHYVVVVVSAQDVGHGRRYEFDLKINGLVVGGDEGDAPAHSVPPKTKTLRAVFLFDVA